MTLYKKTTKVNGSSGGGGTPGGSSPQLQYNNSGAFDGVVGSGVASNGDIGLGTTSPDAKLHLLKTMTIADVSAVSVIADPGLASSFTAGDYVQYAVYAYFIDPDGNKVFSANGFFADINFANTGESANITITPVTGAVGYRVLRAVNDLDNYTMYYDAAGSFEDDYGLSGGSHGNFQSGNTVTPTSFAYNVRLAYNDTTHEWGLWSEIDAYFSRLVGINMIPTCKLSINANGDVINFYNSTEKYGGVRTDRGDWACFYSVGNIASGGRLLEFIGYDKQAANYPLDGGYFNCDKIGSDYEWHFDVVQGGSGIRTMAASPSLMSVPGIFNAGGNVETQNSFSAQGQVGYTGQLKDSSSTVIADVVGGIITTVYF